VQRSISTRQIAKAWTRAAHTAHQPIPLSPASRELDRYPPSLLVARVYAWRANASVAFRFGA